MLDKIEIVTIVPQVFFLNEELPYIAISELYPEGTNRVSRLLNEAPLIHTDIKRGFVYDVLRTEEDRYMKTFINLMTIYVPRFKRYVVYGVLFETSESNILCVPNSRIIQDKINNIVTPLQDNDSRGQEEFSHKASLINFCEFVMKDNYTLGTDITVDNFWDYVEYRNGENDMLILNDESYLTYIHSNLFLHIRAKIIDLMSINTESFGMITAEDLNVMRTKLDETTSVLGADESYIQEFNDKVYEHSSDILKPSYNLEQDELRRMTHIKSDKYDYFMNEYITSLNEAHKELRTTTPRS